MAQPLLLNRLLQLCSANLPVGGFSFSQGLEFAVEQGWVNDAESCKSWLQMVLHESFAATDVVILQRLFQAFQQQNNDDVRYWNQHILACRESKELYLADVAMGKALVRLLKHIEQLNADVLFKVLAISEWSFTSAFAVAAYLLQLDSLSAQSGYCWTFIDNQVAAATKLIPLGQTDAQRLLFSLSEEVEAVISTANSLSDDDIGASLPRLAMASAWHESQYSRLFRS